MDRRIPKAPQRIDDSQMEKIVGGTGVYAGNPLMGMLDMYYQMAMEAQDPVAKADAARTYNETLDKLMHQGVNCAGYRHIPM